VFIDWFITQFWLWQLLPGPIWPWFRNGSVVLATAGCTQRSHFYWSWLFWVLSTDVKLWTLICASLRPCWFTLVFFSFQQQWFFWHRQNRS